MWKKQTDTERRWRETETTHGREATAEAAVEEREGETSHKVPKFRKVTQSSPLRVGFCGSRGFMGRG